MTDRRVLDVARKVRKKMEGGSIYGKKIDMTNEDEILAAAFLLGKKDLSSNRGVTK